MNTTTTTATAAVLLGLAATAQAATFAAFNDRAAFLATFTSTLIDDDLERFAPNDVDFDNSSVNAATSGPTLSGYNVSHTGDETTTQFVNGTQTNSTNTGNFTVDIQFLLDRAGVNGAFGTFSTIADFATISISDTQVNAFGFDTFGFNDQGLSFLVDSQALGVEIGVVTTVRDTLGNTEEFTISASDPFFGVVGLAAPVQEIVFSAAPGTSAGTEFIAIDNFLGGASQVPEPGSALLVALAGCGFLTRRRRA